MDGTINMSTSRYLVERYIDCASTTLKPSVFDEALGLTFALIVAVLLNRFAFDRRISSPPLNWLLTLLGFFMTFQIPVQKFQFGRVACGWIFAICVCGLLSLPHMLSFYLWPTECIRKTISFILYAIVLCLFTADFFRR